MVVEVAAAVLLRQRSDQIHGLIRPQTPRDNIDFLLACRPEGKVYAGYWEFPGGKLEIGETAFQALVRELQEEMGITVTAATPWLHKQFVYPHATVHLNFWRVTAWEGEIGITAPLEHSAVDWLPLTGALQAEQHLSPILPANGPILKGLALPTRLLITHAEQVGVTHELNRLSSHIKEHGNNGLLHIRDRGLPKRADFVSQAAAIAKAAGMLVVLNVSSEAELAMAKTMPVDGVHLTSQFLAEVTQRPDVAWVGASCHQTTEIGKAGELELDYAVLGPVLPTQTHPEAVPLGWAEFSKRIHDNRLPVFALGGMQSDQMEIAWAHGAHGVALMRGW
jgi:8-oxo-dGTP diphosphatase